MEEDTKQETVGVTASSYIPISTNAGHQGRITLKDVREWLAQVDAFKPKEDTPVYGDLDVTIRSEIAAVYVDAEDNIVLTLHKAGHEVEE